MANGTKVKKAGLPNTVIGIILGVVYFVDEIITGIAIVIMNANATDAQLEEIYSGVDVIFLLAIIGLLIYWFIAVSRMHKVLMEATDETYPVSPGKAVGFHFIPFYNLYWIIKWPMEIAKFVNVNLPASQKKVGLHTWGIILLLSAIIVANIDGGLSMVVDFTVLTIISKKIRLALQAAPVEG